MISRDHTLPQNQNHPTRCVSGAAAPQGTTLSRIADPTAAARLTPEQRLEELAAIFAIGLRRMPTTRPSQTVPDSEQIRLDVSPKTSLHVPTQLTQRESTEGVTE